MGSATPFRDLKLTLCMSLLEWSISCVILGAIGEQDSKQSSAGGDLVGEDGSRLRSTSLKFLGSGVWIIGQLVVAITLIASFISVNYIY